MTYYEVYFCGSRDEAYKFPEWKTMTEDEKREYEIGAKQTIGCAYIGVFCADSKEKALELAEDSIGPDDYLGPGA